MLRPLPSPLSNPEVCINLWAHSDGYGYISRIAGRAYVLGGNDKLFALHELAKADFLNAEWFPVPESFAVTREGKNVRGLVREEDLWRISPGGAIKIDSDYKRLRDQLFGPLLTRLTAAARQQMRSPANGFRPLRLPLPAPDQPPIVITTAVIEGEDGELATDGLYV